MPWPVSLHRLISKAIATCCLLLALPNFAGAVNEKNTLDLKAVKASTDLIKDLPAQQILMQQIRHLLRTRHLKNLWQESQKNPGFKRGALNLAKMFQDLERCNLYQNANENTTLQADPKRQSDFYALGEEFGIFNEEALENGNSEGIVALGLHVCLGALGYQDQNYQLTLALFTDESSLEPIYKEHVRHLDMEKLYPQDENSLYRRTPQDLKVDKEDRPSSSNHKNLKPEHDSRIEAGPKRQQKLIIQKKSGTFTGAGGGGNVYALMVKGEMMTYMLKATENFELEPLCEKEWKDPIEFAKDVQNLKLETEEGIRNIRYFKDEDGENSMILPAMPGKFKVMYRITAQLAIFYLCKLKADVL